VPLRPSRPAHASRGRASPDPDRSPFPWSGYFVEPAGAVLPLEPPAEPFPVFRGDLCGIAPEAQPDPTRHARGSRAPDPVRGTNGRVSPGTASGSGGCHVHLRVPSGALEGRASLDCRIREDRGKTTACAAGDRGRWRGTREPAVPGRRSEEHTSEL